VALEYRAMTHDLLWRFNVLEYLVRLGCTYSYTYPTNVKYQELLFQLEGEAREQGLGLWANQGEGG